MRPGLAQTFGSHRKGKLLRAGNSSKTMRRLSLLAFIALLGVALAAPTARAGIRVQHDAHAVFVLPKRDGVHPAVFVSAGRMSGYNGTVGPGIVGSLNIGFTIHHGECFAPDDLDSCVIGDRHPSIGGNFRDGDVFEFDHDLGYAYLEVSRKGVTHKVTWRANADPVPVVSETACSLLPAGVAAGLERDAGASGRVFGRSFRSANVLSSSLSTIAFTC